MKVPPRRAPRPIPQPARQPEPPSHASSWQDQATSFGSVALALLGYVAFLAAVVAATTIVLDIPGFFEYILAPGEVSREFGPDWHQLVVKLLFVAFFGLIIFACVCLMFARRSDGFFHITRVLLACFICSLAFLMISQTKPRNGWVPMKSTQPASAMNQYLDDFRDGEPLFFGTAFFAGSLVLLAWPSGQRRRQRRLNQGGLS